MFGKAEKSIGKNLGKVFKQGKSKVQSAKTSTKAFKPPTFKLNTKKLIFDMYMSEFENQGKKHGFIPEKGMFSGSPSLGGLVVAAIHFVAEAFHQAAPSEQQEALDDVITMGLNIEEATNLLENKKLPSDNRKLLIVANQVFSPVLDADCSAVFNSMITIRNDLTPAEILEDFKQSQTY